MCTLLSSFLGSFFLSCIDMKMLVMLGWLLPVCIFFLACSIFLFSFLMFAFSSLACFASHSSSIFHSHLSSLASLLLTLLSSDTLCSCSHSSHSSGPSTRLTISTTLLRSSFSRPLHIHSWPLNSLMVLCLCGTSTCGIVSA